MKKCKHEKCLRLHDKIDNSLGYCNQCTQLPAKQCLQCETGIKIVIEKKSRAFFWFVPIISAVIMAFAIIEHNRVLAVIGGIGFVLVIIKWVMDG